MKFVGSGGIERTADLEKVCKIENLGNFNVLLQSQILVIEMDSFWD